MFVVKWILYAHWIYSYFSKSPQIARASLWAKGILWRSFTDVQFYFIFILSPHVYHVGTNLDNVFKCFLFENNVPNQLECKICGKFTFLITFHKIFRWFLPFLRDILEIPLEDHTRLLHFENFLKNCKEIGKCIIFSILQNFNKPCIIFWRLEEKFVRKIWEIFDENSIEKLNLTLF